MTNRVTRGLPRGLCPIGFVGGWLKTLTGTPALTSEWMEVNGQTVSDAGSPYNGVVWPNLNASGGGTPRFLRGGTASGATGGTESHTHLSTQLNDGGFTSICLVECPRSLLTTVANLPSYYTVVWIGRFK